MPKLPLPLLIFVVLFACFSTAQGQSNCTDTVTVQLHPSPVLSGDYTWRAFSWIPTYCTTPSYTTYQGSLSLNTTSILGHCNCANPCGEITQRGVIEFANVIPAGAEVVASSLQLHGHSAYDAGNNHVVLTANNFDTTGIVLPVADGFQDIGVTGEVAAGVQTGQASIGFYLRMYTEAIGQSHIAYYGTEEADSTLWPTLTITYVAATNVLVDKTNISCGGTNDGSVTATGVLGSPPYSYFWQGVADGTVGNMATNLAAGAFAVTVTDAAGCTAAANGNIVQQVLPTVSTGSTSTTCHLNDGSVTANGSGAQAPYSYQWSNGASAATVNGLSPGQYIVTVTDALGCTKVSAAAVAGASPISVSSFSNSPYDCPSYGSVLAYASGGTPPYTFSMNSFPSQTYEWVNYSQAFHNLVDGTYTITVEDQQGCIGTATQSVAYVQPYTFTVDSVVPASSCNAADGGATFSFSGGTPPYESTWRADGYWEYFTGNSIYQLPGGTYSVYVYDGNSCWAGYDTVVIGTQCDTVQNLRELNVQDTSVYLAWDPLCSVTSYKIRWKPAGPGPWNVEIKQANTGVLQLEGLAPNATYWWQVRANCEQTGWGPMSEVQSFTTLAQPCWVPDGLTVSPLQTTQVRLNWNQQPGAVKYRIRYRPLGQTAWTTIVKNASWDRHWLTGLTASTAYEWQIKTVCQYGVASGTGWSPIQNFITPVQKTVEEHSAPTLQQVQLQADVFPNPGTGLFSVAVEEGTGQSLELVVSDVVGHVVFRDRASDAGIHQLDLRHQPAGIYLLSITRGQQQAVLRLVIE